MVGEQEQPQQQQRALLGAANLMRTPEFSRWTLSPDETIAQIDLWLRGARIEMDAKNRPYLVADESAARLNAKGRRLVMTALHATLHKGVVLSDFDNNMIGKHTENFHIKIASALVRNWRSIGIKHPNEIPELASYISFNIYAALNRAKAGNTYDKLSKLHVVSETVQRQDKGQGLLGSIFNRGVG